MHYQENLTKEYTLNKMGFQSGINAALGSIAGAAFGIQKTLQQRQEEQMAKIEQQRLAKKEQKQRFRQSIILDAQGKNIQVPTTTEKPKQQNDEKKPVTILGADGG